MATFISLLSKAEETHCSMDALASRVSLLTGVDGSKWSQDPVSHTQVGFWLTSEPIH